MKKINLAISGCMGRMGQQLIRSSKKNKKFKFVRTPKFEEVPYPIVMEPNLVIEYYSR